MTKRGAWWLVAGLAMAGSATARQDHALSEQDAARLCAESRIRADSFVQVGTGRAGAGFDAGYYHISLDLTTGTLGDVAGVTRIVGRATAPVLPVLELDFHDDMLVDSVVTATGGRLSFTRGGDLLSVDLAPAASVGDIVDVVVHYRGRPPSTGFGGFEAGLLSSGAPYAWTLSEPYGARTWWPGVDHPSDKADSVDVSVTVPESWQVASNGSIPGIPVSSGRVSTWNWSHRYPISSYLVSIAAGIYETTVDTYVRPDSLADRYGPAEFPVMHFAYPGTAMVEGWGDRNGWYLVMDMLPILEWWFGPYPFQDEKYGHAQFTWGGGMEHQTISSMGGNSLGLVAHELAHQWYGDAVGPETWPHLWLNEGFATMAELLTWQTLAPSHPGVYEAIFDLYYKRALSAQGTLVLQDTSSVGAMFAHSRVYSKGAMVLHMLRSMVGDPTFREVLQAYAADPSLRYRTATTDDFRRVAERVTGLDLSTFFSQWVTDGTGYPSYAATWSAVPNGDGWRALVELSQTQDLSWSNVDVFETPVELRIVTAVGEHVEVVRPGERAELFAIDVDQRPIDVLIDPDRRVLRSPNLPVVHVDRERFDVPTDVSLSTPWPNPADDRFHVTVESSRAGAGWLEVIDATGRLVYSRPVRLSAGRNRFDIRTDDWAPGLYVTRIRTQGRTLAGSVVITR